MCTIDKTLPILHLIRFRENPLRYLTVSNHDTGCGSVSANDLLRKGLFPNLDFQAAYNIVKVELGLLDPDPNDLLVHQFIQTDGLTGYGTGHVLIRNSIMDNEDLRNIANIGDWLSDEGFIDVTPPDQDAKRFIRVTDIGNYYLSKQAFTTRQYPAYLLVSEGSQIIATNTIETHRNPRHITTPGYDKVLVKDSTGVQPLHWSEESYLSVSDYSLVQDKPVSANGLLYTCVNQLAAAKNLPVWWVLKKVEDPASSPSWTADWKFV